MIEQRALPLRSVPTLDAQTLHLWWLDLDRVGMPPGLEQHGRSGLRMQQRFLLRLLLGAYLGRPGRDVQLARDAAGKPGLAPSLASSGIRFNLSHAGRCLVVAIGRGIEPGVDIEPVDRKVDGHRLATRWFGEAEAERIQQLDAESARLEFLRRWTVREALVKTMGSSIAASLGGIGLDADDASRIADLPENWPAPHCWQLETLQHPGGWFGHLACAQPFRELRQFELSDRLRSN